MPAKSSTRLSLVSEAEADIHAWLAASFPFLSIPTSSPTDVAINIWIVKGRTYLPFFISSNSLSTSKEDEE